MRITARLLVLGCLASSLLYASDTVASECDLSGYESSLRPDPDGTPTDVVIGLMLTDVSAIRDVDQTVTLEVLLTIAWHDQRLRNSTGCEHEFEKIWTPQVELMNSATIRSRRPPQLTVTRAGNVVAINRYSADIISPENMRDFPFDQRSIRLQLGSLIYDADELRFQISEQWTGRAERMSIPDWAIGEPVAEAGEQILPRLGRSTPLFDFRIPASRLADYYLYKFVFPLVLIVMMSWAVFWVDPRTLGPQLSLSSTSMLTLIAYQFTVNDLLPRVGYLTSMDKFVLSSSLLVFLALVEALVSGRLASTDRTETALALDRTSRWVFPATFVVMTLVTLVF